MSTIMRPPLNQPFTIPFGPIQKPAIIVPPSGDPQVIVQAFGLGNPRPTIFITGGAGQMTDEDIKLTHQVVEEGIAAFAQRYHVTVIDGGTDAGVMQMIGDARLRNRYDFPLIGVAPLGKVAYPGYENPAREAVLQEGHSHFVLVDAQEWGDESQMIVNMTRAIANGMPMIGILINGGKIAEKDVYLATTQGNMRIPILVLDGSGRTATNIATAFKTGNSSSNIIKAIIAGGDIRLTPLDEGKTTMLRRLHDHFKF
jgi:hypothetical protein